MGRSSANRTAAKASQTAAAPTVPPPPSTSKSDTKSKGKRKESHRETVEAEAEPAPNERPARLARAGGAEPALDMATDVALPLRDIDGDAGRATPARVEPPLIDDPQVQGIEHRHRGDATEFGLPGIDV